MLSGGKHLKIGSLFSGYGGLDLAVEAVTGAEPAWFVEFEAAPSKILAHHWPAVPNFGDVTKVRWEDVPPVDIITGGSPCQDLSAAGRRAGMADGTRSNLWTNMMNAVEIIRPRLVVWENVLGALSATAKSASDMEPRNGPLGNGGPGHLRALGRVLGDLAEIGYDAEWLTLRASDIGAPHHRARVFLIAYPHDAGRDQGAEQPGTAGTEVTAPVCGERTLSNTESGGRNYGKAKNIGSANREEHSPGNDCDPVADPSSPGSEAVDDSPVGTATRRSWDGGPVGGDRGEATAHPGCVGSQAGHLGAGRPGTQVPGADCGGETLSHPENYGCEWGDTGQADRTSRR